MKNWKPLISCMIILWLGLQLWAGVDFKDYTWPFIGFPMYAHKRGVTYDNEVQKILLRGVTTHGQEIAVIPEDFGMYKNAVGSQRGAKIKKPRDESRGRGTTGGRL